MDYIYAIEAIGTREVKIGTTTDLEQRICTLQTANAKELRYVGRWAGNQEVEIAIHAELATYRMRGEWFDIGAERAVWEITRFLREEPFTDREIGLLNKLESIQQDRRESDLWQGDRIRLLEEAIDQMRAIPDSEPQSLREWRMRNG